MGNNAYIPGAGSLGARKDYDADIYSKINMVQVVEVNLEDGTVKVSFLNLSLQTSATIPLLGLSLPPDKANPTVRDYTSAGWGRYIPQVGDIMLGAYSTDGTLHLFGYSTSYYSSYDVTDQAKESKGGIGWGKSSGKTLKPGDWDFKSARGCMFYMGDKINLSSSNCSMVLNQNSQDINISTPLLIESISSSYKRFGAVRRKVYPTDSAESYMAISDIINPVRVAGSVAQEFTVDLRWGSGSSLQPPGGSLAYLAIGDVVDDLNPTVAATGYSLLEGDSAPIRYYFHLPNAIDPTDTLKAYAETIDALGNYEVQSNRATLFKWNTPLAAWEISNLSTEMSSTTTFDISSVGNMSLASSGGTMDITSAMDMTASSTLNALFEGKTGVVLSSDILAKLGGSAASEPVIKGTIWITMFNKLLVALLAHFHTSPVGPTATSADLAVNLAANVYPDLANILSTKVLTE